MVDEMVAIVGCKGGVLLVTMDQTRIDYLKRQKDLVLLKAKVWTLDRRVEKKEL
jgi:hypothetical protein